MLFELTNKTVYINSGNSFSRAFLLGENFKDGKNLLVFDNRKEAEAFSKILSFTTKENISPLFDLPHIVDFFGRENGWFVTTKELFEASVSWKYHTKKNTLVFERNGEVSPEKCITTLIDSGYIHSPYLSKPGSYKKDGDTLSIRLPFEEKVVALSFFDTVIDEILIFDTHGQFLTKKDSIQLSSILDKRTVEEVETREISKNSEIYFFLGNTPVIFMDLDFWEPLAEVAKMCQKSIVFAGSTTEKYTDIGMRELKVPSLQELEVLVKNYGNNVHFYTKHGKVLRNFLEYNNLMSGVVEEVNIAGLESFVIGDRYVVADDILGDIFIRNRTKKSIVKNLDLLLEIRPNDYVVHRDHGVGIFREIVEKDVGGNKREYMLIEYRADDRLFVPLTEIHRVSKYIGNEEPILTRLSGNEWKKTLEKTNSDVEKIARELLETYAKRRISEGFSFTRFPEQERRFQEDFPYEYTIDQQTAIAEILADMESSNPMDRLLSGDVGFGKTEVAMNAIYRAFLNGKQSILISPLVVLAYEHMESLQKRLTYFGVRLGVLTRFSTQKEAAGILAGLENGTIDCVVATHRILGEGVVFKDLGLLVIDEEHKFGVLDKEKINALKSHIDILSLSATPIPRSLNLALSGVKKISVLTTPPPMKKAVTTIVAKWNEMVIKEAVEKELARGGQVIFLHNRVVSIESIRKQLIGILGKHVRIAVAHGRLDGMQLEDIIIDFKNGKYDILLSTTVIENGVNFLNANTIFIDDAEKFGLAQLHQLRGRVGRKDRDATCYLLYHSENLDSDGKKRLLTIVNNSELGAGFEIALRDLEIRGAGDVLGIKQSGKTHDTGLSLYFTLLEEKIEELRNGKKPEKNDCKIELDISYFLDNDFFDSELDKIRFFRNIEAIETLEDLEYTHGTFREANETLPESFENLFLLLRARIIFRKFGVVSLGKIGSSYVFEFDPAVEVPTVRKFLELDTTGDFVLVTVHKIKVDTKRFGGDKDFLETLIKRNG
ncbi:MAG: CarD family transcriptional regulator [Candidatus Gracilibacteria bacterium]|nr:CarD family transcriptional regulator [Candidatus Gracilibacteria bacterium]